MSYSALLSTSPQQVREPPKQYVSLTERHLQAMWFEQKYFKNLTTSDGSPITVKSPGIWNAEAGPDFKKAHLFVGTKEIRGDIELHLSDDRWKQHQHHLDKRYNDVVFHLSLWKPKTIKPLSNTRGQHPILGHLEPFLTIPIARIVQLIDLDLYPYKTFSGSGRCSHELFRKLSPSMTKSFFKNALEWRLKQKLTFLEVHSKSPEDCFATGIAMALGYKNNTLEFLDLYNILNEYKGLPEKELFALALGVCGFFGTSHRKRWGASPYYLELLQLFEGSAFKEERAILLTLHHIRPFNHPIRRIAYLVKMIQDPILCDITDDMLETWNNSWHMVSSPKDWKKVREIFEERIPCYLDSFWNRHFLFNSNPSMEPLPLLGGSIIREIIINTFLPMLFGEILKKGIPLEIKAFHQFFSSIPLNTTGKSKYLRLRYFGDSSKGSVLQSTEIIQGAYQLHHDFCVHFEASCEGCPFVQRYRQFFCHFR